MPRLPPAVAAVRQGVRGLLAERQAAGALHEGDLLLVACSGGPDSLALAAQTAFVAPRAGLRAGTVCVDHGMQQGSGAAARRAAEACADLGLDPVIVATAEPPAGGGPEAAAREIRYAELARAREHAGAAGILLGHTMDDQAETVLLRLARGSGTRSIAGIPAVNGTCWRPLLGVRREQTLACCAELGLTWWNDPANAVDGPWRTAAGEPLPRAAIRAQVLPALARALGMDPVPALARTAAMARADDALLQEMADEIRAGLSPDRPPAQGSEPAEAAIAVDDLRRQPEPLRRRVLRDLLLQAGADGGALAATHVAAVDRLLVDWHGQGPVHIPGGVRARRSCGRLVLHR